jgi:hypothetical protein
MPYAGRRLNDRGTIIKVLISKKAKELVKGIKINR